MRQPAMSRQVTLGAAPDPKIAPVATTPMERPRWVTVLALLGLLVGVGAYLHGVRVPAVPRLNQSDAGLTPAVAALSGPWAGRGAEDFPSQIVVEAVQPEWAVLRYRWGAHPAGQVQPGWVRVRAKVSPEGKLFWRYGGEFTFQLSDDGTTLVGTREKGGKVAPAVLRRDWS